MQWTFQSLRMLSEHGTVGGGHLHVAFIEVGCELLCIPGLRFPTVLQYDNSSIPASPAARSNQQADKSTFHAHPDGILKVHLRNSRIVGLYAQLLLCQRPIQVWHGRLTQQQARLQVMRHRFLLYHAFMGGLMRRSPTSGASSMAREKSCIASSGRPSDRWTFPRLDRAEALSGSCCSTI